MPPLPTAVEELTPEWLTAALRTRTPEVTVRDVEITEILWGSATKVRLHARYDGHSTNGNGHPPAELCVKGGFDGRLKALGTARAYRLETKFFAHLAPSIDAPLPRCWFAAVDDDDQTGVLIFDDLTAAGATFGDPLVPWSPDAVAAALEVVAAWHADTWGLPHDRYSWLPDHSIVADISHVLVGRRHWDAHFGDPEAPILPAGLTDRARVADGLERLWELHATDPACLSHGDAHVGNSYTDAAGRPAFLDWQAVSLGPPLDDVAYFVTGALDAADRRTHERALLAHYLESLAAAGGPKLDPDAAWLDYRRYALHGFLWATTPPVMQPWANVRAMADRHTAAIVELESLDAVSG